MTDCIMQAPKGYKIISVGGNPTILDLMLLCDDPCNLDAHYTYKKTIINLWVKS